MDEKVEVLWYYESIDVVVRGSAEHGGRRSDEQLLRPPRSAKHTIARAMAPEFIIFPFAKVTAAWMRWN
jgi:hypothetical protein